MAFKKQEFDSDINFSKVLFLHINRIAMSDNQPTMDANVNVLESLLYPYIDTEYKTEIEKQKKAEKNSKVITNDSYISTFTEVKLRNLMMLAERKNLLLEKTGIGYDKGDEDETEF